MIKQALNFHSHNVLYKPTNIKLWNEKYLLLSVKIKLQFPKDRSTAKVIVKHLKVTELYNLTSL